MASQHKKTGHETGKLMHFTHRHANPEQKLIMETTTKTRTLGALIDEPLEELHRHIFEDIESELCNW